MSTIATRPTVQANLANQIRRYSQMFNIDLNHIPEDEYTVSKGGKARTIQAIVAEVVGLNKMVAEILKGDGAGPMPSDEERAAFEAAFATRADCQTAITESAEALARILEKTRDEDLAKTEMAPWGMPMTYLEWSNIAVVHVMYHDGQLNFIQSLNGDDQIHWMEG